MYKILVDALEKHFSPTRNTIFERHLFRCMKPSSDEDLNKFFVRLRQQASKCNFGTDAKESERINLKDKLIDEWAPMELKKKLLEKEYSFKEIIKMCSVHEQITVQTKTMTSSSEKTSIYKVISQAPREINECSRCGRKGHNSSDDRCMAKSATCRKCGFTGHFAVKCKSKIRKRSFSPQSGGSNHKRFKPNSFSKVGCIEDELPAKSESESGKEYGCFKIKDLDNEDADQFIVCAVGNVKIKMTIDSGSKFNLLSEVDFERLNCSKAIMWN